MIAKAALLALISGIVFASGAPAQDCMQHIQSTEGTIQSLRGQLDSLEPDPRAKVEGFIADAEKILAAAREDCPRAQTPLDRSFVVAKVLVAQGNLAAAQLLLKAGQK
jgi:hypothetical protein